MSGARVPGIDGKTAIYTDGTAPGDSGWQDGSSLGAPFSLTVEGLAGGGKVQIRVSNREHQPTGGLGNQFGSDITTNVPTVITAPFRWVRVIISTVSTTPVTAAFYGHRPPMS